MLLDSGVDTDNIRTEGFVGLLTAHNCEAPPVNLSAIRTVMGIDVAILNKRRLRRMVAWLLSNALRRAEPPVLMHMMKRLLLKRKSTFETTE